jgi:hypothetical protein
MMRTRDVYGKRTAIHHPRQPSGMDKAFHAGRTKAATSRHRNAAAWYRSDDFNN